MTAGFYDDAYYLAGYALELILKAKICKTLCIEDFFDFESSSKRKLSGGAKKSGRDTSGLYKPFKVHDYEQLFILSGVFEQFTNKQIGDLAFSADWSIVSKWDEGLRYTSGANEADVKAFIRSIKSITTWLKLLP